MPTWALLLLVIGALVGATWLFVADAMRDDAPKDAPTQQDEQREQAEGVLSVPDDDEAGADDDASRRGDEGRERLDSKANSDGGDSTETTPLDPDLPAVFANLRGKTIALAPASAAAPTDAARLVTVGGLRLACSGPADLDRLAIELALLDRVAKLLERAGATARRVDREGGEVDCVDERVRTQEAASYALIVRADPAGDGRVFAGRAATGVGTAARKPSITLAAELAGRLELGAVMPGTTRVDRALLGRVGAIDLRDGAAVALVELGTDEEPTSGALDALALELAGAIAATASRAEATTDAP